METPWTDRKHIDISSGLASYRIDDWYEAYKQMQRHAEIVEERMIELSNQVDELQSRDWD